MIELFTRDRVGVYATASAIKDMNKQEAVLVQEIEAIGNFI